MQNCSVATSGWRLDWVDLSAPAPCSRVEWFSTRRQARMRAYEVQQLPGEIVWAVTWVRPAETSSPIIADLNKRYDDFPAHDWPRERRR